MSILIRGMEMPQNCYDCPFIRASWGNDYYCAKGKGCEGSLASIFIGRMDNCPLVEIPTPHGRLIDADKLANETFYGATSAPYITYWKFMNAPTVIEAEK